MSTKFESLFVSYKTLTKLNNLLILEHNDYVKILYIIKVVFVAHLVENNFYSTYNIRYEGLYR